MSRSAQAVVGSQKAVRGAARGFSLLELMIAMVVFLVVAGAAFSLFDQQVSFATHQQNLSGVDIGLRNAMSQLEMDLSGSGQNLLAAGAVNGAPAAFSLGVIIQNSVPAVQGGNAPACAPTATWSYPTPSACFDALTIPSLSQCTATVSGVTYNPVLVVSDAAGFDALGSSATINADDANTQGSATVQAADTATCFKDGDELLVVQFPSGAATTLSCDSIAFNYCMVVVELTQNATVSGGKIQLTHTLTGTHTDPLGIMFPASGGPYYPNAWGQKCGAAAQTDCFNNGAFIVDLGSSLSNTITYFVQPNPANAADQQLNRCVGGVCSVLTDEVIGFKVGAALWSTASKGQTDIANYFFNSAAYCSDAISGADCSVLPPPSNDPYDFTLVRSVRISMIGRTVPSTDMALRNLKNGFDTGPYLVQQGSVVVDLRNLSNTEFGN